MEQAKKTYNCQQAQQNQSRRKHPLSHIELSIPYSATEKGSQVIDPKQCNGVQIRIMTFSMVTTTIIIILIIIVSITIVVIIVVAMTP
ncbi:hypothetical protein BVRB_6g140310 [Beta vulgaris subsp. vulgaris]|nr:hypothetical protein BVRB_6g140310 [Beta vulgaris subsp. vulgaris]